MKKLLLSLLLLLSVAILSTAEQIEIRHVGELIKPSEVIARVTIICVMDTRATERYSKVAYAKVTDPIKGVEADSILQIENDAAGVTCPNVRYREGEDVLVFARKMLNGHYQTLYADAGKFLIKNGMIDGRPFKQGQGYESARGEIEREIRKLKRSQG